MGIDRRLFVGITSTFLGTILALAQTDNSGTDNSGTGDANLREATSLLESFQANLESIEKVDVAIHRTQSRHSDRIRAFEDVVTKQRLIVNEDERLGIFATVREIFRYQDGRPSIPTQTQIMVVVRDGDHVGHRYFPKSTNWVKLDGESKNFSWASDRPDFRFIGLYAFPFSSGSISPKVADSILGMYSKRTAGRSYRLISKSKAAIHFRDNKNRNEVKESSKVFNLKSGLIETVKAGRRKAPEMTYAPDFREDFTWGSVNSIYVPLTILGSQKKRTRDKNREKLVWIEENETSFRWFAVNENVEPPEEMMNLLKDLNLVLKFTEAKSEQNIAEKL